MRRVQMNICVANCRVVVAGSNLKEHVKSAYAYYYDADMNIKSPLVRPIRDQVFQRDCRNPGSFQNKQVSDHYPVEFEIE